MHGVSQASDEIEASHRSLPLGFPRGNLSCKMYKIMRGSERGNINDWKTVPDGALTGSVELYRGFY